MIEIKINRDKIDMHFRGDFDTVMTEFIYAVLNAADTLGKRAELSVENVLSLIVGACKFCSANNEPD
ncbi:MAG: hypothetical protein Q4G33_15560 [bacterium]|nr:hypothetical protein [bacterium]